MKDLIFVNNWNNKLNCNAFACIRVSTTFKIGQKYRVVLQKSKTESDVKGVAEVVAVKEFHLENLNEFMSYLDSGYSIEETKKIIRSIHQRFNIDYVNQMLSFVIMKYIKGYKEDLFSSVDEEVQETP